MDRRSFIIRSGGTVVSIPMYATLNTSALATTAKSDSETCSNNKLSTSPIRNFSQTDWETIAIVQNHLFPSESETPGAIEINALTYLYNYLNNPVTDPNDVQFLLSGTHLLQTFSKQKEMLFNDVSTEQRELILREFEKEPEGRRWLVNILNYILEALLTDPVYGGNPEGIGWKWLEHRAGDPHPPANKRYWLL